MPERVVNIASEISELAAEKLRQIQRVADSTKTLALNARIEAARAGELVAQIRGRRLADLALNAVELIDRSDLRLPRRQPRRAQRLGDRHEVLLEVVEDERLAGAVG